LNGVALVSLSPEVNFAEIAEGVSGSFRFSENQGKAQRDAVWQKETTDKSGENR
jgi:hypothetical protein